MRWVTVAGVAGLGVLALACAGGEPEVPDGDDVPADDTAEAPAEPSIDDVEWDPPDSESWQMQPLRDLRLMVLTPPGASARVSGSDILLQLGSGSAHALQRDCGLEALLTETRAGIDEDEQLVVDTADAVVIARVVASGVVDVAAEVRCDVAAGTEVEGVTWCMAEGRDLAPEDCLDLVSMVRSVGGPPNGGGKGGGGAGRDPDDRRERGDREGRRGDREGRRGDGRGDRDRDRDRSGRGGGERGGERGGEEPRKRR